MREDRFFVFRRGVAFLVFAAILVASAGIAAENPPSAFKDPYNGAGIKLPAGGGEPGKAYMAFIKAAYNKDYEQVCKLVVDAADVAQCLEQKEVLNANIGLFTLPRSHKVLGGFMKGEEATLNVAYTHYNAAPSTGFVVMKKEKSRWVVSSTGGAGSTSFSAQASATVNLSGGSGTESAGAGQAPEAEYTGPAYGTWTFTGKDNRGVDWKGTIDIKKPDPNYFNVKKYQLLFGLDRQSEDSARGGELPCTWDPGRREIECGNDAFKYTAVLSDDGKSLINGKWTEMEKDWGTNKVTVTETGTWSANYAGGHADR